MKLIQHQKYKKGIKENGLLDCSGTNLALGLGLTAKEIYTPKIPIKKNVLQQLINFGCSSIPWLQPFHEVINKSEAVSKACNKLKTFETLANDVPIPVFTTSKEIASAWFVSIPKTIVFCRTLLTAAQGEGIVVARSVEELVDAPLYTLYIPKKEEYRFHVAFNKVIHIQKKKKLTADECTARGITDTNKLIRNLSNGYVFSSNIEALLSDDGSYEDTKFFWMTEFSIRAVKMLGLDFGAIDIIIDKHNRAHILEVNTAPRLEEPTLSKYVGAINNYFYGD